MGRKPLILAALGSAIAVAALWFALRGFDWHAFRVQIDALDWRWLCAAAAFDIASYAAQGVRWRYLLGEASIFQTTRAIYAGLFLNEIIPLRPGEAVRAWIAARDLKRSLIGIAPSIVAERLMDGRWFSLALLAVLAVAPLPVSLIRAARTVALLIGAALIAAWLLGGTRIALLRQIRHGLTNAGAVAVSGCYLAGQAMAFWAVTRASHLHLGLVAAFVVMMVVRIGTLLPGAPANLGTHQFSTMLGLSIYGVPRVEAAGFAMIVFVVLTAPLLMLGFAACVNAGVSWRSVRLGQ